MPFLRHIFHRGVLHDELFAANVLLTRSTPTMAPRAPSALPSAEPFPFPASDYGFILNATSQAANFSHGLDGVDQKGNFIYVNVLFTTVMALLAIAGIYHWACRVRNYLRRLVTMDNEADQRFWMYNRSTRWAWLKRHIIHAPLFHVRHNREMQFTKAVAIGTLPSRFDSALLTLILVTNIAYCLALNWLQENPYSVIASLRGRSGCMAVLNMVLAVITPLRNSPTSRMLGVTYDTLNLYHRCFGRLAVLETIIHTCCWGVNTYQAGGKEQLHVAITTSNSYKWGMVGTVLFTVIAIVAWGPVRHSAYETFLNAHRLMVFIALIGAYLHLSLASLPQVWYVQICFALWAAEWIWRAGRIWYHNISRKQRTEVTIEALPNEAVRATFKLARPWRWNPGSYIHVYLPALALWSSHPFSVAWADSSPKARPMSLELEKLSGSQGSVVTDREGRPSLVPRKPSPTTISVTEAAHAPEGPNISLPRNNDVHSISCVIRAQTGMTRALYERAMAAGPTWATKKFTTWGAVEGPYGGHYDLASYGTVILFAGGVGITHQISFIYHLLLQRQAGLCSTKKILLVWSVPNKDCLEWIRPWMDQILRLEGRRDVLRIQIFVTKPRDRHEAISKTGSVRMFPGRCRPETVLAQEITERIGAVAVTMCGPGVFGDAVRAAVRPYMTEGVVDFHEESFTY